MCITAYAVNVRRIWAFHMIKTDKNTLIEVFEEKFSKDRMEYGIFNITLKSSEMQTWHLSFYNENIEIPIYYHVCWIKCSWTNKKLFQFSKSEFWRFRCKSKNNKCHIFIDSKRKILNVRKNLYFIGSPGKFSLSISVSV